MSSVRESPVARFSLISLLTMAVLAVVLGNTLEQRIDARALDSAADTTSILGELAVRRYVTRGELRSRMNHRTIRLLDDHLRSAPLREIGVRKVKVFDARRRLVYSTSGEPAGTPAPARSNVATALGGERVRALAKGTNDDGRGAHTLSVYAPLRYEGDPRPAGAFEVYLDYGPTQAAARRDILTMWAIVGGALVLLWLMLFRLVSGVSRALRRQVVANRRQATHDRLTELPNRALLFERAGEAAAGGPAALLQIDLDGFREINDTLGHDHGDDLLVEVADRLRAAAGPDDLVTRLGGDEFAVLRAGAGDEAGARALAQALVEDLRRPLDVRGTTIVLDATVGIALAPQHGTDATALARRAEVAMYQAKRSHRGVQVYDAERDHHNRARLELLGELEGAIRGGELVMAYQPKIDLAGGAGRGVEALVRWQHPVHGLLYPGAFIPAAEVTSLARPLTIHVIGQALADHRRWREEAGIALPVAVNLAGACVMDVTLPAAVAELLAAHDVPAGALTLEISERTIMTDVAGARRVLEELRGLGLRLSLDDFGTGQTSLAQLRQIPLDEMKIDRSVVTGDERLLASVVEIAHKFDLRAVGEGVETPEIAAALAATGCDEAQGFLFARPMWAADVPAWIAGRERVAA